MTEILLDFYLKGEIFKMNIIKKLIFSFLSAALLASCASVPLTGRRQLTLIPGGQLAALGESSYREVLAGSRLSSNREQVGMIERVGRRIAEAAESFMIESGRRSELANYHWEFSLIEDDNTINAWAMPGGKIAFYTGILKLMDSEDEVAVVMGHEVAHIIANHGNERMSQVILADFGGMALSRLLDEKPEETKNLFMTAFGLGTTIGVMLPYSRRHEYEADEIGIHLMHMAGYDVQAAISFWEKMDNLGGASVPEFLSTHPSSRSRIDKMKKLVRKLEG